MSGTDRRYNIPLLDHEEARFCAGLSLAEDGEQRLSPQEKEQLERDRQALRVAAHPDTELGQDGVLITLGGHLARLVFGNIQEFLVHQRYRSDVYDDYEAVAAHAMARNILFRTIDLRSTLPIAA